MIRFGRSVLRRAGGGAIRPGCFFVYAGNEKIRQQPDFFTDKQGPAA